MTVFPKPPPLAWKVVRSRLLRKKELLLTARKGIFLRGSIVALELIWITFWSSSSILLDAIASSIDIIASLALIWCVRKADTPPDRDHPLGHGRFEPIAGLLMGCSMIFIGGFTIFEQVKGLSTLAKNGENFPFAWIIPLFAVILLEFAYQSLKQVAKRKESPAMMADAAHYRIDAVTSLFALIALGFAAVFPALSYVFDHIGALFIGGFMGVAGVVAARKNIHQLVDRSPPEEAFKKVQMAARSVDGVLETEKIRIQTYGPDAQVAIDIEVDPMLSVEASHEITQFVRREIQKTWPAVRDVIVHVEPYYPGDHET